MAPATTAMSAIIGKDFKSMDTVMSILDMGQSLGMSVGPLIAGISMDYASLTAAFLFSGLTFCMLLIAGMVLTGKYRKIELNSRLRV